MLRYITALILFISALLIGGETYWFTDFDRGIQEAKKLKRNVIVYFYSDYCPYCRQMEEFVFGDPEVDSYIREKYVFISLPVDLSHPEVDRRFNPIGTPYFVFYDPDREKILLEVFGSREKEDFLNLLIRVCNSSKTNLRRC